MSDWAIVAASDPRSGVVIEEGATRNGHCQIRALGKSSRVAVKLDRRRRDCAPQDRCRKVNPKEIWAKQQFARDRNCPASIPSQSKDREAFLAHFWNIFPRSSPRSLGRGRPALVVAVASALTRCSWLRLRMSSFCPSLGIQHASLFLAG